MEYVNQKHSLFGYAFARYMNRCITMLAAAAMGSFLLLHLLKFKYEMPDLATLYTLQLMWDFQMV